MAPNGTEQLRQEGTDAGQVLAAPDFDTSVPNAARIYDALLGGKDNFAADREVAEKVIKVVPHSALACHRNRAFLGRAVRHLANVGIHQYLDIGSGLPTQDNVHQIAHQAAPGSRVVYVDYDPLVVGHARALLSDAANGVMAIPGDLRAPGKIIGDARQLLDFTKPVAVLLFAILHFLTDDEQPHGVVRSLVKALPPGSALAISHLTSDGSEPDTDQAAREAYEGASAPVVPRTLEEVSRFFDGLTLANPGVVDINLWPKAVPGYGGPLTFYGSVGTSTS